MEAVANDYLIEAWGKRSWQEKASAEFIYTITCAENNKVYVGSTREPKSRFMCHRSKLRSGTHENKNMQEDYRKYGEGSFVFKIIQKSTSISEKAEANNIRKYRSYDPKYGYNDCSHSRMLRGIPSINNR